MLQHYEVLAIVPGTLTEEEAAPIAATVTKTVEQAGGTDFSMSSLGKSRLAYPIRHIRYGYFFIGRFTAESTVLPTIQEKLSLLNNLLRVIVSSVDPKKPVATKITVISDVRDGRDRVQTPAPQDKEPIVAKTTTPPAQADEPAGETTTTAEKIKVDEIDKKLDELLTTDIAGV